MDEYEVVQTRAPHERGVKLMTTIVDPKKRSEVGTRSITYPDAYEEVLSGAAANY